jgi:hypothetical protein
MGMELIDIRMGMFTKGDGKTIVDVGKEKCNIAMELFM